MHSKWANKMWLKTFQRIWFRILIVLQSSQNFFSMVNITSTTLILFVYFYPAWLSLSLLFVLSNIPNQIHFILLTLSSLKCTTNIGLMPNVCKTSHKQTIQLHSKNKMRETCRNVKIFWTSEDTFPGVIFIITKTSTGFNKMYFVIWNTFITILYI